jgi:hypothetical protein
MRQFRLVIVDYAKAQLDNPIVKKILSDVVFIKQKHFLKTEPNYVVTDKHDMIGTHYLIYDTTEFLEPKLVFAIRTTFMSRAQQHRIETPLMSIIPRLEPTLQNAFNQFQSKRQEIVDCNAWFVDPAYSKKNSGLNLSDLGYLMVCTHVLRCGFDHIVGCTNETYNASRWLLHIGSTPKGLYFEHPAVKAPHMMILLENFNMDHFKIVHKDFKELISEMYEVFPKPSYGKPLAPFSKFAEELYEGPIKLRKVS